MKEEMKRNKKKTIIASIMLICVILWSFVIFGFSGMNAEESDKASYQTVATIITNNLNFTNKIGATHSTSSNEEIVEATKVINPLIRKVAHFTEYFILAMLVIIFVNYVAKWKASTTENKLLESKESINNKDVNEKNKSAEENSNAIEKSNIKGKYKYIYVFLICLVICAFYSASDEFHQIFISGRTGQVIDACIDTTGAFFGLIFYTTYHLAYKAGQKNN